MSRYILTAAAALVTMMAVTTQHAAAGKVPGLHVYAKPPNGYGHPRVPRIVRNFNPKQQVRAPKRSIGLAQRR